MMRVRKQRLAHRHYGLKIYVTSLPELTEEEPVYVTGSFNDWDPAHPDARLESLENGTYYLDIPGLQAGTIEFKFTRGSWETVEVDEGGEALKNRTVDLNSETVLHITIGRWTDRFHVLNKMHSASRNVHIMDDAFPIPGLNRSRRIWVYLPEGYAGKKQRYPVLYMHDGQNLFDESTAYSGEWGVDETLDQMRGECIVIGIDNGGYNRINEYNLDDHPHFGKSEGRLYLEFIVNTLKPFVDKKYRTLRGKQNTFIAGSSMGGLISFYAGLLYPAVFGAIGVFSPSFAMSPNYRQRIAELADVKKHGTQRYYFYAGALENKYMVRDMRRAVDLMKTHARADMEMVIREDGRHNEAAWKKEFPLFYQWILNSKK